MNIYNLIAIVVTLAVIIAYCNHRFIKMQMTIGLMTASLALSLIIILLKHLGFNNFESFIEAELITLNFHDLLINGMLSFLLFAGALTVDFQQLKKQKWEIGILASVSTIFSAVLIGFIIYSVLNWLNIHLPLIYCFLFGALISPTDPIAVLATFKKLGAPKRVKTTLAGESLFNDGVGIVIFLTIYQVAFSQVHPHWHGVVLLFIQQALGGIVYGLLLGLAANWLIRPITDYKVIILITLGIVTGGYSLAQLLEVSGPLAMVVAGIVIANKAPSYMSKPSLNQVHNFWEIIDEVLNAILFLLIGFEVLVVAHSSKYLIPAMVAIPAVLLVRLVTVAIPLKLIHNNIPYFTGIIVWGGLRGGLAVALALALPPSAERDLIVSMTYGVVLFSVLIQGMTIKPLIKKIKRMTAEME